MRTARILLAALAPFALLALPSDNLIAVPPYTPTPKAVPTYERHVGQDETGFSRLQQQITDEENRRRLDDQEHRSRLTEHDRLIGGLVMQSNNNEKRLDRMEERLFYILMLMLGGFFTLIVNTVFTVKTHWNTMARNERNGVTQAGGGDD